MNSEELKNIIRKYCLEKENKENVKKYSMYFKGGYDAYGLNSKDIKEKINELKKNKEITLDLIYSTAPELIKSTKYEEPAFALLLLNERKKDFTVDTLNEIEKWYRYGIKNWAHADILGMFVLPVFLIDDIIEPERFASWLEAANSFQRRSVPVTFIKPIKQKRYDINLIIDFLEILMKDPAREVQQGIGWFLREAWKLYPNKTEKFLLKWKDSAPRLIFQYACEKMDSEKKLLFKRDKIV